jgi:ATP-dependent Clp protease adapter protein ClpS
MWYVCTLSFSFREQVDAKKVTTTSQQTGQVIQPTVCPRQTDSEIYTLEFIMSRDITIRVLFLAIVIGVLSVEVSAFMPLLHRSITHNPLKTFQRPSRLSLSSTVIERPQEKEKVVEILDDKTVERENKYGGEGWEIRLWNDPFNKREFVARCLSTICGKSDTESYQIMIQAHKNGYVLIRMYLYEKMCRYL